MLSNKTALKAQLYIPNKAEKIVVFLHGSGSGRFSPRNQFVANWLSDHSLATLLLDLLTDEEEKVDNITREFRFDISLLANRLIETFKWLNKNPLTKHLKFQLFGSSTGAAAALAAASFLREEIHATVSRGGRPDLAAKYFVN